MTVLRLVSDATSPAVEEPAYASTRDGESVASVRWISADWRQLAICRGMDVNIFFDTSDAMNDEAKEICRPCPVRLACLDDAMRHPELRGVWGATSEQDRTSLRRP